MSFAFKFLPVSDDTRPLTIAVSIAGGSGTGKTYRALLLARGIADGKPFAVIDTENRRAVHYRNDFPEMVHVDMSPIDEAGEIVGFPPERWIAAIDAVEAQGLPVVVIDSFSHAWEGIGGVLEMQAEELEVLMRSSSRDQSMRAWAKVKPRYRRLVERIIRAQCHVIICIRAKAMIQNPKGGNMNPNKIRRPDLPWDIACDKDLVFEMTASLLMTPEQPGKPILLKCADVFKPMLSTGAPLTVQAGATMREWANGADFREAKRAMDDARHIARKGSEAMREFWKGLSKPDAGTLRPILAELQALAKDADEEATMDPFAANETVEEMGEVVEDQAHAEWIEDSK